MKRYIYMNWKTQYNKDVNSPPQVDLKFIAIPSKILVRTSVGTENIILKFIWKSKGTNNRIAKNFETE